MAVSGSVRQRVEQIIGSQPRPKGWINMVSRAPPVRRRLFFWSQLPFDSASYQATRVNPHP